MPNTIERSGQGEFPKPCMSLLNQYLSGPSKRERNAARRSGFSWFPKVCRRSSQWYGCVLQGLLNAVGGAAGRIMTPFLSPQSDLVERSGKGVQDGCLSQQQVSRLERMLGEDKETCACTEDVPQSDRDPQTRGGGFLRQKK